LHFSGEKKMFQPRHHQHWQFTLQNNPLIPKPMDVECPYCEKELEIIHDDGYGYQEGVKHHQECPHCGKSFVFETIISVDYEVEKADCLNGGNHNYELTTTSPKEFSKMECSMCGDARDLTDAERMERGIGTKESYFESIKNQLNP
jgi:endogenous inhibitor of DNA gyrase (YacG/DUF329 family)